MLALMTKKYDCHLGPVASWMMYILVLCSLGVASCGTGEPKARGRHNLPETSVQDATLSAAEQRVEIRERVLRRIEARVRDRIKAQVPVARASLLDDASIDSACRATSHAIFREGDRGAAASRLRLTLQEEQVTDVRYLPFTFEVSVSGGIPDDVLSFIQSEAKGRGVTHLGVGAVSTRSNRSLVTIILLRRFVSLSSFPREVAHGSTQLLWIRSASSVVRNPEVIVSAPDGRVVEIIGEKRQNTYEVPLTFDLGKGRYMIQVLAEDMFGVQITNELEVWVGQPPMRVEKAVSTVDWGLRSDIQVEKMLDMVNRFRASHGLSSLSWNPTLSDTARAHSEDMCDHGFFGHRSPHYGELVDRVGDELGKDVDFVLENIAMSVSIAWAHEGLVASPSHRRNLLDPRATHVGIGVAQRNTGPLQVVYVTQHIGRLKH
jgi:hypothetical protein